MQRKVIITCALNGGVHGREANPNIPITPDEIARDAADVWNAGAAVVHIHGRNLDGSPGAPPEIWEEILSKVRAATDLITNFSSGGALGLKPAERLAPIFFKPDLASLNMGPLTFTGTGEEIYIDHTRSNVEWFAKEMLDLNVKAEMEVYSLAMMKEVENLIAKGLVKKPYLINFVLSVKAMGALDGTPENLMILRNQLPPDSLMELTAIGKDQLPLTTMTAILGGHIRVGLEDNIFYRKGELANSNAQFVERTVRILRELEMEPSSTEEARAILGIE